MDLALICHSTLPTTPRDALTSPEESAIDDNDSRHVIKRQRISYYGTFLTPQLTDYSPSTYSSISIASPPSAQCSDIGSPFLEQNPGAEQLSSAIRILDTNTPYNTSGEVCFGLAR
jgi:hypothetical protein